MRHFFHAFASGYRRAFSISEIEQQPVLQWMFGASLFYFFLTFNRWMDESYITAEFARAGRAVCWPYFSRCTDFYVLHAMPYGFSQPILYMGMFAMMALIVRYMWKRSWVRAHALLSVLLGWKMLVVCLLSYLASGPYDYYHFVLTGILLFIPHKEYFLKVGFVFMYFVSATIKFTPAWVLGTYFSTHVLGLPLMPTWMIVIATNVVIFGQIVESWLLLSANRTLQRIAYFWAVFFHLVSGVWVSFNFPAVALPPVLILFGSFYRYTPTPFTRKAIAGWIVIALIGLLQLLGFVISPDRFMTLEGNKYGLYMFDANHQCSYTVRTYVRGTAQSSSWKGLVCSDKYCTTESSVETVGDETVYMRKGESASSSNRCDPYERWTWARAHCADPGVTHIAMQFDHSINGGPFYRIVDEASVCDLTYKPFSHNEWIKIPPEAAVVGQARQNAYSYQI